MVLSGGFHVSHDGFNNFWWDNHPATVVEQDVVALVSFIWPCDLADWMQRPNNIGNVLSTTDLAMRAFDVCDALAKLLDHFSSCA